jgi:multiple sugar transport system substrate-binding protein
MSQSDGFAYCPFTYGYSNYARPGFAAKLVHFGDVIQLEPGRPGSTMLGGTGIAVSSRCRNLNSAVQYAGFVASPAIQRGVYFSSGGQPGHRLAWVDESVNSACSNYFRDTLATLDRAFVRPRYPGYLHFQDRAGEPIHAWLRNGAEGNPDDVLNALDGQYREHGSEMK